MQRAPFILYARKSTESEDKQMLSIPAQLRELREFAVRNGLPVARELTESASAREPGRPVFSQLLKDVAAGKVNGILCWKLDRLARNPIDGGALTHYLGKGLLREIVTPEGRYNGTGDSKFMLSVLFGAATKMTDDLSVAVKRGNKEMHQRGRITGQPPLGYVKVRDRLGFRGAGKVVPDPERFHLVERVWRDLGTGGTTVADVWRRAVGEWGLTTRPTPKRPSHPPSLSHFYQLLESRFYAGQIVRSGELFEGEHQPMVSPVEFDRIQSLLRHAHGSRPSVHRFLYSGMLHCGDCTRLLVGESIKNRYDHRYTYYRCGRRRAGYAICRALAPTEKQITADVERALEVATLPATLVEWTLDGVDWWVHEQRHSAAALARAKQLELDKAENEHRRLTDLVVAGTLDEQEYLQRRAASLVRLQGLRRAIEQPTAEVEAWQEAVKEVMTLGATLARTFRDAGQEGRRALLGRLYENLIVTNRITRPRLRPAYQMLNGAYPIVSSTSHGDVNLPSPRRIWPQVLKNARPRSTRERAFLNWCTKLKEVRTRVPHDACVGLSPQRDIGPWNPSETA